MYNIKNKNVISTGTGITLTMGDYKAVALETLQYDVSTSTITWFGNANKHPAVFVEK